MPKPYKKVPTIPHTKKIEKKVRPSRVANEENDTISFVIGGNIDLDGDFGFGNIASSKDLFCSIIAKFRDLDGWTFQKLRSAGSHFINVEDLSDKARERLTELKHDDIDEVFSVALTGRQRVICLHFGKGLLEVLWWDPDHKVCPSKKKHT